MIALIEAQTESGNGVAALLESTLVTVDLTDETTVNGEAWEDLRPTAMLSRFKTSQAYIYLSVEDRALVDALIATQSMQAKELCPTTY